MTFLELIGAMSLSTGAAMVVDDPINKFNEEFVAAVDSGDSCWNRVGGEPGTYITPHHFSLSPTCNYTLRRIPDGMKQAYRWVLERK